MDVELNTVEKLVLTPLSSSPMLYWEMEIENTTLENTPQLLKRHKYFVECQLQRTQNKLALIKLKKDQFRNYRPSSGNQKMALKSVISQQSNTLLDEVHTLFEQQFSNPHHGKRWHKIEELNYKHFNTQKIGSNSSFSFSNSKEAELKYVIYIAFEQFLVDTREMLLTKHLEIEGLETQFNLDVFRINSVLELIDQKINFKIPFEYEYKDNSADFAKIFSSIRMAALPVIMLGTYATRIGKLNIWSPEVLIPLLFFLIAFSLDRYFDNRRLQLEEHQQKALKKLKSYLKNYTDKIISDAYKVFLERFKAYLKLNEIKLQNRLDGYINSQALAIDKSLKELRINLQSEEKLLLIEQKNLEKVLQDYRKLKI